MPNINMFQMRAATMDDAEAARTVINAAAAALSENTLGVADWQLRWNTPTLNHATDTLLAYSPEGQPIGYVACFSHPPHVEHYVWARVHPDYLNVGIGSHFLDWAAQRAMASFEKAPADARLRMTVSANANNTAALALFEQNGFSADYSMWHMGIDLTTAPILPTLSPEIVIRPYNAATEAEAVVHIQDLSFADHRGYVPEPFEALMEEWRHWTFDNPHFDPNGLIVAEIDGQLVGSVLCEAPQDNDEKGYIFGLGVLPAYRGRGIGKALLLACFQYYYGIGRNRVELTVDAESLTGAQRIYQNVGMSVFRRDIWYKKTLRDGKNYQVTT